jgi:hypothetical protein
MKKKKAIILSTALITICDDSEESIIRFNQYSRGIRDIFEIYKESSEDIFLVDNTISDYDVINIRFGLIFEMFNPQNLYLFDNNKYGQINKGMGLIEQWKYILPNLMFDYEKFVHFEPRQMILSKSFFNQVDDKNYSCFKLDSLWILKFGFIPYIYKHFQTGLFCSNINDILNYANSIDYGKFLKNKTSIERSLYEYFKYNNIEYDQTSQLGLLWHSASGDVHI